MCKMNTIEITGSPGIDVDNSVGEIEGVILNGQGSGTAFICYHGRSSDSLYLIDVIAFSYSAGIDLHDDGDGTSIAPIIVRKPGHYHVNSSLPQRIIQPELKEESLRYGKRLGGQFQLILLIQPQTIQRCTMEQNCEHGRPILCLQALMETHTTSISLLPQQV